MPVGEDGRRGLGGPGRVALEVAGRSTGALFGVASALRGKKCLHPAGAVHEAEILIFGDTAAPPAELLRTPAVHPGLVRFSRSIGMPRPLPDLLGMSLRFTDVHGPGRHQDFLLVTSVDAPVLHHLFVPARDVWSRPYSSSLPYRSGSRRYLVGATPLPGPRPAGADELERLATAAATGGLRFGLAVAGVGGRFAGVGEIHVGARLADELDRLPFSPWNTGGGVEPDGMLNRLRDYAYPLSQRGWGASRPESRAPETPEPGSGGGTEVPRARGRSAS